MSAVGNLVGSIVKGAFGMFKEPKTPVVPKVAAPKTEEADTEEEKRKILRKKKISSPTVLTTPLGLTGQASTRKPTLLGG